MTLTPPVPFEQLPGSDLVVDAVYTAGSQGDVRDDPLSKLLPGVGNQGGFRAAGGPGLSACSYVALYTSGSDPDWPDELEAGSGLFTYYGDNKRPGQPLLGTGRGGNRLLESAFAALHASPARRAEIPPFLVFRRASYPGAGSRAVQFLGLAVPGSLASAPGDDLVAIWRTRGQQRFQNYRATFTILDAGTLTRGWLTGRRERPGDLRDAPAVWSGWVSSGRYEVLQAPRQIGHRSRADQLPASEPGMALLHQIHGYFAGEPVRFEACAAELWRLQAQGTVEMKLTRATRDGGRDALGTMRIGPSSDPLPLEFALEAKCFRPGRAVGVRDTSRLVSRLRHRQFGVLVTTSYVLEQAYRELRHDTHPVVILAGADVVDLLRRYGLGTPGTLRGWLEAQFPLTG